MRIVYSLQFKNSLGCWDTVSIYEDLETATEDRKRMEKKHPQTEYMVLSHYLHEREASND